MKKFGLKITKKFESGLRVESLLPCGMIPVNFLFFIFTSHSFLNFHRMT